MAQIMAGKVALITGGASDSRCRRYWIGLLTVASILTGVGTFLGVGTNPDDKVAASRANDRKASL